MELRTDGVETKDRLLSVEVPDTACRGDKNGTLTFAYSLRCWIPWFAFTGVVNCNDLYS